MGSIADLQAIPDRDPLRFELIDFLDENCRINDHAVANDALSALTQHA